MSDCTVYIDEAGDLGINRGTRWFVLTAVVVDKTKEPQLRKRLSTIKTRLNLNAVHMRNISDFSRRAFIIREINEEDFTYMNILVDTNQFDNTKIPTSIIAYNYVCKYLLQRVSLFMEDTGRVGDVVLSARGTSRDGELIEYIQDKLLPYPGNSINESLFNKISAKTASSWDLLQLADICATTMFWGYEVNGFGFSVPCFSMAMQKHLFKKNQTVLNYGIRFFTHEMKPDFSELRKTRFCGEKK